MPDTLAEMAKKTLKRSGKLTLDPAAYTAGFLAGYNAAEIVILDALEKYGNKKA